MRQIYAEPKAIFPCPYSPDVAQNVQKNYMDLVEKFYPIHLILWTLPHWTSICFDHYNIVYLARHLTM